MKRSRNRKCLNCSQLFVPDYRNRRHQKYCAATACRGASKAASQARWLAQPANQDYFGDACHVARVRAWRALHPGYWRGRAAQSEVALQDDCVSQSIESTGDLAGLALQEICRSQPAVLLGLIAHLTDSALQEDIARSTHRFLQLGQDILAGGAAHAHQTIAVSGARAPPAGAVQLARSAPGA